MFKTHTFWLITSLLVFQVTAMAEDTSAPANARDVMLKYVESQKKLNSYIIKANSKSTYVFTGSPIGNGRGRMYRHSDLRFDGNRVKESMISWGDVAQVKNLAKENAFYMSVLWDGEMGYHLSLIEKNRLQTAKYPGTLRIYKEGNTLPDYVRKKHTQSTISTVLGYVLGNDQNIGTMFLRADANVQLLDQRSKVNGVDCYVVETQVPQLGEYRAWIDPVHGFNLARLQTRRKTGDLVNRTILGEDAYGTDLYEVLEFQEVNGVWLPKTFKTKSNGHDGGYDGRGETLTELYEVNLDPDHDREGSFRMDDIPNGTRIILEGSSLNDLPTWQNGKIVDSEGKVVLAGSANK